MESKRKRMNTHCWKAVISTIQKAEFAREFYETFLKIPVGGQLQPFTLLPWQWEGYTAPIHGWRRPDASRRFSQAYISVAKKNGKTELLAADDVLQIVTSPIGCEIASVATEREQAAQIYRQDVRHG